MLASSADTISVEKVREHEIEEAHNLQQALLPTEPLRARTAEIAHRFRPAAEVGGDFVDYFVLSDGAAGIYLGDVVGKGLPAALYAALAVGTFRGIHKTGEPPAQVLELLNKRLRMHPMPRRFCAVQYAIFDPASLVLYYASAGLPGPVHISSQGCRELRAEGLPPGMFEGVCYEPQTLQLASGDAVLFLTDGLTDAQDPEGGQFGIERILEICAQSRAESADALLQRVFAAVDRFAQDRPQQDDMTSAVLKVHARRE